MVFAMVYHIWMERNARIFIGKERDQVQNIREVKFIVCVRILNSISNPNDPSILTLLNA